MLEIADQKRKAGKEGRAHIRMGMEMTEREVRLSLRNTSVVGITNVIESLALEL